MFPSFPLLRRNWAEEALWGALGVDFGSQEGALERPSRSQNAPRKGVGNGLKFELVLGVVWEPSWGPKRVNGAAGWRNGGGLWGGEGGPKPCKELSQLSLARPSARWAGGFKWLTPFRRPQDE